MKQISFEGWPVTQAWHNELDAVKETQDINLLPVYDLDHTMIWPKDYKWCLLGATVEVHITLIHYLIGKKGSTLVADLWEMIVLQPPQGLPQSPTKRSLLAGPSSTSPKKHHLSAAPNMPIYSTNAALKSEYSCQKICDKEETLCKILTEMEARQWKEANESGM
ncbi:hypothetical protein JB92DRAFT_2826889 [Gautieria morchelliformis]|nr:hypothetical protein JB92DRAFT_2826889 [Gautieria morchelliformis]